MSSSIVANYRKDVGCPNSYHDLVRMLRVKYTAEMAQWPINKLSSMIRAKMALQMKPELSWAELKRLFRDGIDAQKGMDNKIKYANEHSLVKTAPYDTFTISYVGNLPWGGISDYVDSVFSITDGHLLPLSCRF